ncbi:lamin tail domain-containing protein [Streptomyces sp. NPDC048512]|uniref:lamin tail domain-containing protein n=1 Tax=unclassified Streptomyces TaxID=2593676 RepID=UPI00321A235E
MSGAIAQRLRVAAPVLQLAASASLGFVPAMRETELPPDVLLLVFRPVLATVRVHTGIGLDTPRDVYEDRRNYVWDNDSDTATLRNEHGRLVDEASWGHRGHHGRHHR